MVLDTVPRQQVQQYLRFQLITGVYGMLPTQQLTEISSLSLAKVIPIPDTLPEIIGVHNWRGEILWVMDLGYWLGFNPLYTESFGKGQLNIMIVHHQGQRLGLGVKSVDQMIWCDAQQIRPAPHLQTTLTLTKCLGGYWSATTGEAVLVLDGGTVIEELKRKLN